MPKRSAGRGIQDKKPIAAEPLSVDFVLPEGMKVARVLMVTPESAEAAVVEHTIREGRIRFTLPRFLVYAVAQLQTAKE